MSFPGAAKRINDFVGGGSGTAESVVERAYYWTFVSTNKILTESRWGRKLPHILGA
ncbi:MAG: hypothetical protein MRZ79_11065 [Bacteroidia bacterium]|nr:hypothetical protein [Bacteroidia bacterium]